MMVQFNPVHKTAPEFWTLLDLRLISAPMSHQLLDYLHLNQNTVSSPGTTKMLKSHNRFQLQIQQAQEIYWRGPLELLPLTLIALIKM